MAEDTVTPMNARQLIGTLLGEAIGRHPRFARAVLRACEICRVPGASWALVLFDVQHEASK